VAEHVGSTPGLSASDRAIATHAAGGVVVSKDVDFAAMVEGQSNAPQLLWIRLGNTTNVALFTVLHAQWARIEHELRAGAAIVEVR
jgi:predicted nuclease of predicted toxin-antitoxin system